MNSTTSQVLPKVALVGRPNVGKSRLFNRICGGRDAIVHDKPGVTRDVMARDVDGRFTLLDTGGIGLPEKDAPSKIVQAVEEQVFVAVESSDLILLVVDGREGVVPLDEEIAARLRKNARCPVHIVANKCDNERVSDSVHEFNRLGFGEAIPVSAEHRVGIGQLFKTIHSNIPEIRFVTEEAQEDRRIKITFVGKPNVGKSSITNRLLSSQRLIVSDVPGTTRDSIALDLNYPFPENRMGKFRLVDTAGLRPNSKVDSSVEYFSNLRTRRAIEESDVVFLLLDAMTGVTRQDKALAGEVLEAGRSLVLVVNKWDLAMEAFKKGGIEGFKNAKDFQRNYREAAEKELFFLPKSPFLFISAKTGFEVSSILGTGERIDHLQRMTLPTGRLNRTVHDLIDARPPKRMHGKPFKVFYVVQTGYRPFRFRLYCNRPEKFEDTYRRYLEAGIIESFDLEGSPIRFDLVGKERRNAGEER
ncbi:ribosome biogenesis GTPase Der [Puniceicoccus vermicola]|uniref:GTPase Der n=1 Tax=Puniceicoccus vermicola TaxID=388746 RepID=A0A7X1E6U8_9BACT|nr:ribosome biogenesis GTPase Der [Puniceicoccus vermicola]MBC2603022.1 ribosome biogenesis GTPase Der [Puniceicoccus vermicola]